MAAPCKQHWQRALTTPGHQQPPGGCHPQYSLQWSGWQTWTLASIDSMAADPRLAPVVTQQHSHPSTHTHRHLRQGPWHQLCTNTEPHSIVLSPRWSKRAITPSMLWGACHLQLIWPGLEGSMLVNGHWPRASAAQAVRNHPCRSYPGWAMAVTAVSPV